MGNRAEVLEKSEGKRVLMAFEEAIGKHRERETYRLFDQFCSLPTVALYIFILFLGFMVGTQVLDKDGVSAAAVMAEIAKEQYDNGSTLTQLLDELYEK